jgi:FixJ family two-component response regulator
MADANKILARISKTRAADRQYPRRGACLGQSTSRSGTLCQGSKRIMAKLFDVVAVVAVVDNDDLMRQVLHALLTRLECDVELYRSGETFLAAAAASKAQCLMIDIHLDGMSGVDLGRRLAAAGHRLPVVCMTADTDTAIQQQALDADWVVFLQKPFGTPELIEALDVARRLGSRG